jgi:hypothetical protein
MSVGSELGVETPGNINVPVFCETDSTAGEARHTIYGMAQVSQEVFSRLPDEQGDHSYARRNRCSNGSEREVHVQFVFLGYFRS